MHLLQVPDEVIVGVSDTAQNVPFLGLKEKPCVGKWTEPNVEKIAELKPEAVLTYGKYPSKETRDKIESLGIKVIGIDFYYAEKYDQDLQIVAQIFSKKERAEEFLQWKNKNMSLLTERLAKVKPEEKIKVLCLWTYYFKKGIYKTFAPGSSYDQIIKLAGGINLAGELNNLPESPEVSSEWVISKDPGAIVMVYSSDILGYTTNDLQDAIRLKDEIGKNPVLGKTAAVSKGKVYFLNISGLGRFVENLYMAKWFYPQLFQDLNPEQVLKEYFEKWVGTPYKGKWAYPEP
ncbi:vitamin B12-binding protein precursor [Moorella mulderi DSM 14980]|uniref:Vitamin B12-binding protein n=1 Tax=Moorella mulderi DSM 14980 TaxID=1122241 RepID=A0A151AZ63_9FIRM|nr:vitamin B12-binding protein precursor [Moorella mulderi DSM 14980]